MNKKTLFAFIVLIGCIVLLVGSYMQWNQKISSSGTVSSTPKSPSEIEVAEKEEPVSAEPKDETKRLLSLAANTDEDIQKLVEKRLASDKPLKFLITGSAVMEKGNPGYAEQLEAALEEAYGDSIEVTVQSFDMTSDLFIDSVEEELDLTKGFDLVLLEPFNLKNNGVLTPEDQETYIERFQNRLTEAVEDAVLVLHPSQPLHNAVYYPLEVDAIKEYASSNKIPYINHWDDWPASDSDDLPNYLDEDSAPNTKGAEVWANALIKYFIAE